MMDDKIFRRCQDSLALYTEVYAALSRGLPYPERRTDLYKLTGMISTLINKLNETKGQV